MRRLVNTLPMALILAACSGGMSGGAPPAPPPPPELDPVGVYDCVVGAEGMEFGVTLTITGTAGEYTGSVDSEMGPGEVSDIVINGNEMTFVVDTPDMAVFFGVVFDGDTFTGDFDAGGMAGYISGKKR